MRLNLQTLCDTLIESAPSDPVRFVETWHKLPQSLRDRMNRGIAEMDSYRELFAGNPTQARRRYIELNTATVRGLFENWELQNQPTQAKAPGGREV